MRELLFAYGSNMCSGRFRAYGVTAGVGQGASLTGYCLRFNKKSTADGSGKANVQARPDSEVWGVLYGMPAADLSVLDKGEGRYHRIRLSVRPMTSANITGCSIVEQPEASSSLVKRNEGSHDVPDLKFIVHRTDGRF